MSATQYALRARELLIRALTNVPLSPLHDEITAFLAEQPPQAWAPEVKPVKCPNGCDVGIECRVESTSAGAFAPPGFGITRWRCLGCDARWAP